MKTLTRYIRLILPAIALAVSGMALSAWAATPQIRAGVDHTVHLRADGTIWTSGSNWTGQLGDGTNLDRPAPVQVGLLSNTTNWVAIATGDDHALALKADGSLWAWGANSAGQLGDGSIAVRTQPVRVGSDNDWTAVAAGGASSFALKANGELYTWGSNTNGQLGLGSTDAFTHSNPVKVTSSNWKAVSAGEFHTLALKADGSLWAWGDNTKGQLGNAAASSAPARIGTASDWTAIAAGGSTSFAIKVDGTLWAWGRNDDGQLGTGAADGGVHNAPVKVTSAQDWTAVSAGNLHVLAVKRDGTFWAWGDNTSGQLGDGTKTNRYSPTRITDPVAIADIVTVAAGAFHSMALKANGELYGSGDNWSGQLGSGSQTGSSTPFLLGTDEAGWVASEPGGDFTVARRSNGTLWTWGDNSRGQLGDNTVTSRPGPAKVGAASNWVAQSAGWSHTVALQAGGTLWAWGNNSKGQLGNGTTADQKTPTRITASSDWAAISAGDFHTLALKTDGTLWAWGDNTKGQLGDGSTTGRLVPTRIVTGYPGNFDKLWVAISAGGSHSLALHADGTLWAWGSNDSGQAGDSASLTITKPRQVAKLSNPLPTDGWNSNWVAIAAGLNHSLALQADGTLWAWGNNYSGQLGNGDPALHPAAKNVPVLVKNVPVLVKNVPTIFPYVSIAAGDNYSAARRADGTLWSWGNNTRGQLGTGPHPIDVDPLHPKSNSDPVQELSLASDWVATGIGSRHIIAPKASGSLWAWGDNSKGELGYSTTPDSVKNSPVPLAEGQIDVVSAVDFNAVAIGTVPTRNIYIRNTGSGPLTVTGIVKGGADSTLFDVTAGTCGSLNNFAVKTGGSCAIVASFNPSAAGAKNATLTISSSDPLTQILTIGLSGTAVVPLNVVTSVSPAGSGTITPHGINGTVLVVPGSSQQFTITPNTGYHVVDVKVDGISRGAVSSLILPTVTANTAISASFAVNTYAITMNAGANGAISGPTSASHGTLLNYVITSNPGYHVVDVTLDGKSMGAVTSLSFPALLPNAEITASFAINTYTITLNSTVNGVITGPASANHGDSPTYAIVANSGYHVTDVMVDGISRGPLTSLSMPSISVNKTIAAYFAVNTYTITVSSDAKGTITPSGNVTVTHGASQTLTFTPLAGFNVVNVIVDGVTKGSLASYAFTNVTNDNHTIKVIFIPDGDVDNDGKVDVVDALKALRIAVGLLASDATFKLHGDVAPLGLDGMPAPDKQITVADALLILRKAVGVTSGW